MVAVVCVCGACARARARARERVRVCLRVCACVRVRVLFIKDATNVSLTVGAFLRPPSWGVANSGEAARASSCVSSKREKIYILLCRGWASDAR